MSEKQMPKVVIILGPPGAGKGTQAEILVEKQGFFHFETSKVLEEALRTHDANDYVEVSGKKYYYGDEQELFNTGALCTPEVVAFLVEQKIRLLAHEGKRVVFSGSPRTIFEAQAYLPIFRELFSQETLRIVHLVLPPEASIHRNSHRRVCSQCRYPVPYFTETEAWTRCPKCAGELVRRGALDTPDVIRVRLQEYTQRTLPIMDYFRKEHLASYEIDGDASIETVAHRIAQALSL